MSESEGPFEPIRRMMRGKLRDGGVYQFENSYRRSIGLEERVKEAQRGLLELPHGAQRDRVSIELVAIRTELRGLRQEGLEESRKSSRRHAQSVGIAIGGIVVGIVIGLAGILMSFVPA